MKSVRGVNPFGKAECFTATIRVCVFRTFVRIMAGILFLRAGRRLE
jgi:hypothetical protein